MRRPIASIAFILALLTGAWFGQAYALFAPVAPVETGDTAAKSAEETVWRFYDAIDLLLRTGDDAALGDVVDPAFVDHTGGPDTSLNRDRLIDYLTSLRQTNPALRVIPGDLIVQADRVVVPLALTGTSEAAILGIPLTGTEPWPQTDILRVRHGKVVERWGDGAGYEPFGSLFSTTLSLPYRGAVIPTLRRITVAAGSAERTLTQPGPAIILLESGRLDVALPGDDSGATPVAGQTHKLVAGETIVVPSGIARVTSSAEAASAVALTLTVPETKHGATRHSEESFESLPSGVSIASLAGYTADLTHPGQISVELARVALPPGARLGPHQVAGVELVAVESGTLTVRMDGEPNAAWLMDARGLSTTPGHLFDAPEGYGLSISGADSTAYQNETDRPITLLLLAVTAT